MNKNSYSLKILANINFIITFLILGVMIYNCDSYAKDSASNETSILEQQKDNSSFYQKLADGQDVNLLIVGDSIGEGAGASDKEHRWASLLKDELSDTYGAEVTVTNVSMGANTSFAGYVRTMLLDDGIDYDMVIFCFGQNDSLDHFATYYEAMIRAAKNRYPHASMISILESCQMEYTKKMKIIQDIAAHYDIPIVDTIAPFSEDYKAYVSDRDVIHPNDNGQALYAETLLNVIKELVNEKRGFDPAKVTLLKAKVKAFNKFYWYGVDEFKRKKNTFILNTKCNGVVLGIDYYLFKGNNKCKIFIDGEEYATQEIEYKTKKRHIKVLNDWTHGETIKVENEIKVVFSEDEIGNSQADSFNGLVICGY